MKTINEHITHYQEILLKHPEIELEKILKSLLERIEFLEEIYVRGGKYWDSFSEEFRDAAYKERRHISQETSAIYEILRKQQTI